MRITGIDCHEIALASLGTVLERVGKDSLVGMISHRQKTHDGSSPLSPVVG